jgi:hypothetical protein
VSQLLDFCLSTWDIGWFQSHNVQHVRPDQRPEEKTECHEFRKGFLSPDTDVIENKPRVDDPNHREYNGEPHMQRGFFTKHFGIQAAK